MSPQMQMQRSMGSILLVGCMFAFPFIISIHLAPLGSFYNEVLAFFLGLCASLPLLQKKYWKTIQFPKVSIIFLSLIALVIAQVTLNRIPTRSTGLIISLYFAWASLLMQLGALHRNIYSQKYVVTVISNVIVAIAWLNVIYVGLQLLQQHGVLSHWLITKSGVGAIGQVNHFADYMAIALASHFYLNHIRLAIYPSTRNHWRRSYFWLTTVLFLTMLVLSGSRSSWLYLGLISLTAWWFSTQQLSDTNRDKPATSSNLSLFKISLYCLAFFIIIEWLLHQIPGTRLITIADRFGEFTQPEQIGGLKMRLYFWCESLDLFFQQSWLGIGFGQTRWMTFLWLDPNWQTGQMGSYEHAHNLFIQLLTETGIIGTLMVCVPLIFWLTQLTIRHINIEYWWLLVTLSIISIHSMLEYPLWYAYFLGLTAYLVGYLAEQFWQIKGWQLLNKMARGLLSIAILLGFLIIFHTVHTYQKFNYWTAIGKANQISAENIDAYYEMLAWANRKSLLAAYTYPMYVLSLDSGTENLAQKLAVNEMSLRILPSPKGAYLQALYLNYANQHNQAIRAMQQALQAFPSHYQAQLETLPRSAQLQLAMLKQVAEKMPNQLGK